VAAANFPLQRMLRMKIRRRQNEGNFARNSGDHENLAFVLVLHPNALESNKEIKFSQSMFVDLFIFLVNMDC